jgi:hypothetical protein
MLHFIKLIIINGDIYNKYHVKSINYIFYYNYVNKVFKPIYKENIKLIN